MTYNYPARDFAQKLIKLHRFADLVEDNLVERVAALELELSAVAVTLPEHERRDLFEHYSDDFVELANELPTILRFAVLTAADTASEVFLNDTCQAYARVNEALVELSDMKGTGIYRAQAYLKKVASVNFPDDKPIWTTILRLHELRNSIIHADGIVASTRQQLREWSKSMPGLRITVGGSVVLDREFTKVAIEAYEDFAAQMDLCTTDLGFWKLEFPIEET